MAGLGVSEVGCVRMWSSYFGPNLMLQLKRLYMLEVGFQQKISSVIIVYSLCIVVVAGP